MSGGTGYEAPGIAGSGAIATGLAAVSTMTGDTILLARSEASAWRAEEKVVAACAKIDGAEASRLRVTTDPKDLAECDDVGKAIGDALHAASGEDYQKPPALLVTMEGEGKLGRKSGQGFYEYD